MNQIGPKLSSKLPQVRLRPLQEILAAAPAASLPLLLTGAANLPPDLPAKMQPDAIRLQPTAATGAMSTTLSFVNSPLIGADDRVLHIGDSHTVGIYGREMDKHLRSTGARVETYGSAGSSPRWYITGQETRSGFFGRDEEGNTDAPADWKQLHPTPKLPDLLGRFKPNIIMISLGANLINASPEAIDKQVRELADIAKASGAKIIWVGPPDGRESDKPNSKQEALYAQLQKSVAPYGAFVDSRPLTEYPASGGDGIHYWGPEGTKIAKQWAQDVFSQIQAMQE